VSVSLAREGCDVLTGLSVYLGDSATLSYLHLFRYIVETISGPSAFTLDPRKEKIVENVVSLPAHVRPPCMKPDRQTAEVLVDSYFTNVRPHQPPPGPGDSC